MRPNAFAIIVQIWNNLTPSQKTSLGVAVLLLGIVVAVISTFAGMPHYSQIYGNMTETDASNVVSKLKEMKVPYRLSGNTVLIPAEKIDDVRLELAGEGLPQGGNNGFELFDKVQMGQSEFGERMTYLRALQGELARTICQLNSVRTARVHIAMPEQRLYNRDDNKPSASVVLDLRTAAPSAKEVKAITHLVSSAVEGLEPKAVTVVDTKGDLLSDLPGLSGGGAAQLEAQRAVEAQIEQRVQGMLDRVLGPEKTIARASVTLNMSSKEVERETYTPVTDNAGAGVLESQHRTVETYNGGKPGSTSTNALANIAVGAAGGNAYSREESTTQFRISKEVEHTTIAPGEITKISLAIFVDEGIEKEQIVELQQTLAAAAGLDTKRGDQIVVQGMAFDTTAAQAEEKAAKQQSRSKMLVTIGKYVLAAVLAVAFLFFLLGIFRATLTPVRTESVLPEVQFRSYDSLASPESQADALASLNANPSLEDQTAEEEDAIRALDPERVAQVIKGLMAEEG
ncbi:MAG: flagellar basal-body MS-ring/collar protein FliF [Armatimonadota bacterium]